MAQKKASKIGVRALEYCRLFVGVKEYPPGSNHGPNVDRVDRKGKVSTHKGRVWHGGIDYWCYKANGIRGGYPWCSAFITTAFAELGRVIGDSRRASVGFLEAWAAGKGYEPKRPYRGDIVCFNFTADNWEDHVGIVDRVLSVRWFGGSFVGTIRTIEGNTSAGNNANGGQVQVRYRSARRCVFIRIPDES